MKKQKNIFIILLIIIVAILGGLIVKGFFFPKKKQNDVSENVENIDTTTNTAAVAQNIANHDSSTNSELPVQNTIIEVVENVFSTTTTTVESSAPEVENDATLSFNEQFQYNKGIQKGSSIRNLIQAVILSNVSQSDHLISFELGEELYSKEDELISLKGSIVATRSYSISFIYDSEGYISTIVITEI